MVYLVLESRLQFVTAGKSRQGLEMGCHVTLYSQEQREMSECMHAYHLAPFHLLPSLGPKLRD